MALLAEAGIREWDPWVIVDEECGNTDISQILGCAIVITVILGCAKLYHTHWKSTTLSEKERIENAVQRQMSQRRKAGPTVPFGIRAIESGIQVEGVWISRPNSPEGTRETSIISSKWDDGPRKDFHIDIECQEDNIRHRRASVSSSLGRASVKRSSSERTSRDSSLDCNMSKAVRSRHPPLAYSRYTGNPALQQGSMVDTLEGLEALYKASGPMHTAGVFDSGMNDRLGSSGSSSKSASDSEPISAAAPRLLSNQRTRQQSADLDRRRMSQAAETGQLTPRTRREIGCNPHENDDYFYSPRTQSPTPSKTGRDSPDDKSPTSTWSSQLNSLPLKVRKSSLPDVTPFTQFCMTAPASPLSRPASPASSISSMGSSSNSSRPGTRDQSTRQLAYTTAIPAKPAAPHRSSFEKRDSTILRGHGTGFEILQPGTFPAQKTDPASRNAPPVSLLNNSSARTRSNSADRQRHKLQKKRRPSVESGTSSREDVSSIIASGQ